MRRNVNKKIKKKKPTKPRQSNSVPPQHCLATLHNHSAPCFCLGFVYYRKRDSQRSDKEGKVRIEEAEKFYVHKQQSATKKKRARVKTAGTKTSREKKITKNKARKEKVKIRKVY